MALHQYEPFLAQQDAREFFHDAVHTALLNQRLAPREETVIYIVNLLMTFIRTEHLYESTSDGYMIKPLALIYNEAITARSINDRDKALRKLGDIALFISGLFADSLSRSLVDVDYYIAMGGNAYGYLADSGRVSKNSPVFKDIFIELASRFADFVDILNEVGRQIQSDENKDIMRLYEHWLCTGSQYSSKKLQKLGICPVHVKRLTH